jgi:hypothetical protein
MRLKSPKQERLDPKIRARRIYKSITVGLTVPCKKWNGEDYANDSGVPYHTFDSHHERGHPVDKAVEQLLLQLSDNRRTGFVRLVQVSVAPFQGIDGHAYAVVTVVAEPVKGHGYRESAITSAGSKE